MNDQVQPQESPRPEFVKVGTVDEVPEGEMKGWEVNGVLVGVANVEGDYYAFHDCCTHQQLPADGQLPHARAADLRLARRVVRHPDRRGQGAPRNPRPADVPRRGAGRRDLGCRPEPRRDRDAAGMNMRALADARNARRAGYSGTPAADAATRIGYRPIIVLPL